MSRSNFYCSPMSENAWPKLVKGPKMKNPALPGNKCGADCSSGEEYPLLKK